MAFVIGTGILNIAIALLLSLMEGIVRKLVRARVHSREGPPIIQPYLDLLKLLGKEDLEVAKSRMLRLAPKFCMAAVLLAALLTPMGLIKPPLGESGDAIAFIYLIGLAAVAVVVVAASSESPYAYVGLGREVMLLLTVEPVLVIALVTAGINAHSLRMSDMITWHLAHGFSLSMVVAAIALFLSLQAQSAKLPFDIAEADQEIMGGPFVELSGPKLALFKWSFWAKQVVFASLLCQIFLPWPRVDLLLGGPAALAVFVNGALNVIINLVKILAVVGLIGLIDVVNPRLRIDQALNYFLGLVFVSLIGLAFALVGA